MTEPDTTFTDDEIAAALLADTPEPDPAFEAELRKLVQDGFPRKRRLPAFKLNRPLVAAAASVVLAVAVAVPLIARENDKLIPASGDGGGGQLSREAAPGGAVAESAPPIEDFAAKRTERRIERSAALTLSAPADEIDRVADGITTVTDRYDGFVLRSSLSTGEDGAGTGDFQLRIPAKDLQPALRDLAKLGEVRSRSQSGQDVTREFVSAEDRLEAARAERRSLLRRLEVADNDTQAEAIRRRLDLNAGEIRGLRGQVRELRTRTDYAKVSVTLRQDGDGGGSSGSGDGDGLGGAVDDALASLEDSVEILVRALGVLIPLGLLAAALALAARAFRHRRREAALG
jgi:hypothetical protein